MDCKCQELASLERIPSQEMQKYANDHLAKVSVDNVAWEIIYQCPKTGIRFLKKFIHTELHGGGIPVWTIINEE